MILTSGEGIDFKFIDRIPLMVRTAYAKIGHTKGPQFPLRIIVSIALEQRVEPIFLESFTPSYKPPQILREAPTMFKTARVPRAAQRIKKWNNGPVLWSRSKVSPLSPIILEFLPEAVLNAVLLTLKERNYDRKEASVSIGIH